MEKRADAHALGGAEDASKHASKSADIDSTVECWDCTYRSLPLPMTALFLPAGRKPAGGALGAVLGVESGAGVAGAGAEEQGQWQYILVWDVAKAQLKYQYRVLFAVSQLAVLPLPMPMGTQSGIRGARDYFLLGAQCLWLLDTKTQHDQEQSGKRVLVLPLEADIQLANMLSMSGTANMLTLSGTEGGMGGKVVAEDRPMGAFLCTGCGLGGGSCEPWEDLADCALYVVGYGQGQGIGQAQGSTARFSGSGSSDSSSSGSSGGSGTSSGGTSSSSIGIVTSIGIRSSSIGMGISGSADSGVEGPLTQSQGPHSQGSQGPQNSQGTGEGQGLRKSKRQRQW
ncbi:hypothetical protein B484DRAFT_395243 [Ochromonadaceae sp. CCMP2298]|nr:hypothetical protein B484DRAFT_395243 [Ochromonadaceae sp. CCMP2298]